MEQAPIEDPAEAGRLDRAASFALEEARIILPGIQALLVLMMLGTAMDAYVVAHLVVDSRVGSAAIALLLLLIYLGLWFVYPWLAHRRRRNQAGS